ncbi:MAG: hypothetical protein CVT93_08525 [Bacteroidetes bacterium HGW-Bacteroidetes-10]|nr:MAG: hypothetical protein CVT93_08525 [Bacteroidetes bacterium HGW-Bacteroidetes-10]
MLYMRMLLSLAVSLYTSRIVLNTLGVQDFGIYNVVGGFVSMLGFLNSSMSSATQRFLSFEIGRNDSFQFARVFSMSVSIHIFIGVIILILAESVGLWFVNVHLTIPPERLSAANWVYHFSVIAFIVGVISVPYNSVIIAHERMNVFAWVSIVEVSLKLLIVFMLLWFGFDKLKLYAVLVFVVSLIIRFIYSIYCNRNFPESKFRLFWDKPLFITLISYAGWSLWGSAAGVLYSQGVNVLLNIFFGPAINAARGIAYQVQGAINSFVSNFQMAMNPQIIKSYASDDIKYMHQLLFQGAKYSFFLLFALSLPIIIETEIILKLWLKIVPEYTVIFTQLVIVNILIDSISGPLMTAAQASGKIKLYQGVVGGLLLLILPLSYLFFKLGFPAESTFYISILISIIATYARLIILRNLVHINIVYFLKVVVSKIIIVCSIAIFIPLTFRIIMVESSFRFVLVGLSSITCTLCSIYFIGLNKTEKEYLFLTLQKTFNRVFSKKIIQHKS